MKSTAQSDGRPPSMARACQGALVLIALAIAGTPILWVEKGVPLSEYRAVGGRTVANQTGKVFDFDVAQSLTERRNLEEMVEKLSQQIR